MKSSPKSLPIFSGEDFLTLSSVMRTQDVLPIQLLVEPLALWLVRLYVVPEDHTTVAESCVRVLDGSPNRL
jgi:hypothetical protein